MRRHIAGFSLFELVIFLIASALVINGFVANLQLYTPSMPVTHYNAIAFQLADQCMELQLGQRRMLAGIYSSPTPPNTCSTTTIACQTITGFTVTPTITCNTAFSGDTSINRTLTVSVTGLGGASLALLLASY